MNINKVVLVGTIISDVVETQSEKDKMVRFKLVTNRYYRDSKGEKNSAPCYHDIICWNKVADIVAKSFSKGDTIGLIGRINNHSKKQADGTYKNYSQVVIEEFYYGENRDTKKDVKITSDSLSDSEIENDIDKVLRDFL